VVSDVYKKVRILILNVKSNIKVAFWHQI